MNDRDKLSQDDRDMLRAGDDGFAHVDLVSIRVDVVHGPTLTSQATPRDVAINDALEADADTDYGVDPIGTGF